MDSKPQRRISYVDLDASSWDRANAFLAIAKADGYHWHDKSAASSLDLLSVTLSSTDPNLASTVFSLEARPELCNATGMLHGGAVALIFDICTSMTIGPVARQGFWNTGHVSRTLNCTYLRPIPQGTKCTVESEIVHLGRRVGMLRGRILDAKGRVCYTCEHGKASVGQEQSKI